MPGYTLHIMLTRRDLLTAAAAATFLSGAQTSSRTAPRFRKSICSSAFPTSMPPAEKIMSAKAAGFVGIELRLGDEIAFDTPPADLARIASTARDSGIAIVSLWPSGPLQKSPLNSPDPAVRAKGVDIIRQSLAIAGKLNCGALLLYPGRVGSGAKFDIGYQATWDRFSEELAKVVPEATSAKILLTIENVWNKFLLSPLEMRTFVDQFHSPWFATHFDMGNVMQFGYPQDWILTLGPRIKRIHVKDYKLSARAEQGKFVPLFEGDVDFKGVMQALVATGYSGFLSPEYGPDPTDPNYIRTLSTKLDRILAMA